MKKFLLFLLVSVFGFVLVACGETEEPPKPDVTDPNDTPLAEGFISLENKNANDPIDAEGYYTVGTTKIKTTDVYRTFYQTEVADAKFNYLINSWTYNSEKYTNMVDGLIENDKYGNLVGAVARGYKVVDNADGTQTWTIQLKEAVKWVDNATGTVYGEVKADDFVAGIEYVLEPINGSATAGIVMGVINGAKEYYDALASDTVTDLEFSTVGVKVVSDYQVAYTLKTKTPYFLSSLTYSPFLPLSRAFLAEKGTDFGQTANDILVNGAYRMTSHVLSSMIIFEKNVHYWDKKHVYVNKIEQRFYSPLATPSDPRLWFEAGLIDGFTVQVDDEVGYKKYVTGEDGTGSVQEPVNAECNGVLNVGDATYIGYFNFARDEFEYNKTELIKNAAQKAATAKALLNVNFRKGFLYGLNVIEQLKRYNPNAPYEWLMRGYTNKGLVVYEGKDYTEYVEDIFNQKQGTTGVSLAGIEQKSDPVYNVETAAQFFQAAKTELLAAGLTEADFPIKIDVIGNMNPVRRAYEETMYSQFNTTAAGVVEVVLNIPNSADQNTRWGSVISNYDFSIWSGWGPDYADPKTFLNTVAIKGDLVENMGFDQRDAANIALEQQVLGAYDALFRTAEAITDITKLNERYQAFAEAEYALIYDYALVIPWLTQSGYSPLVSRVVPFQTGRATYGLTSDKLKNVVVSLEPMTKEMRAAVVADYNENK